MADVIDNPRHEIFCWIHKINLTGHNITTTNPYISLHKDQRCLFVWLKHMNEVKHINVSELSVIKISIYLYCTNKDLTRIMIMCENTITIIICYNNMVI